MEDYLLGKKRVDEVLRQGDENVSLCVGLVSRRRDLTLTSSLPAHRSATLPKISSPCRTPTRLRTSPLRSAKTLYWQLSNRNSRHYKR